MRKILAMVLMLCMVFAFAGCSEKVDVPETNDLVIVVEGYGEISIRLCPENAPITVENFKKLAYKGAYNGTIFHRVINNFMIQCGDTTLTSYGKADSIKGEFASNGVNNPMKHERGVLSMARADGMNNSATSQFFICQKNCEWLDGDYAAFGYVTDGMDIVDRIASMPTNSWDNRPYNDIVISEIRFVGE